MTTTLILSKMSQKNSENFTETQPQNIISLEEFLVKPPERMEWVDGNLVEKTGMTFKHSLAQSKLARYWGNYKDSSGQGGEVLTEILCRTAKQGRRPDVAYITPELLPPSGNFTAFSQSFPLIAEVASPEDSAEELFAKAQEYLESGCQEIWLLFPEARLVFVNAGQGWRLFNADEVVNTQTILAGFSMAVSELLA
ncbi:Uma2 family endonuclease [Lyngbya sp. CCAP 1446/10]|uniref:Uma2 family endonuclease n=1 Tax=Lyngbya sp. CCAP 1446/10 TaxID=439293 RepID=UPI002AA2AFAE|nr:Uma2 family endonuclease [Lyngbya sp. CCAP 1446/10]MCW6048619.1 Uma2 family endonuclease [Lyngbya sp. CCAP 1446/10]